MHVCVLSCFSRVRLFVALWSVACEATLSMAFSRRENWNVSSGWGPGAVQEAGDAWPGPAKKKKN